MNVSMINTELTRGGASRMAAMLTEGVNRYCSGVSATLYHCENDINSDSYVGLKKYASRHVNAFFARLAGSSFVYDFHVADDIAKLTSGSDVIHLHNLHGYYLDYKRLLRQIGDRPLVWTWHDMWGATGRCGFSFECEGWQQGCMSCPNKSFYPAAWIDNAKYEYQLKTEIFLKLENLTIVSPSEWLADIAKKRGFHAGQVKVIPNPVDTAKFSVIDKEIARSKLNLDNKFTVLFIASDCGEERKGYSDFAKMISNTGWSCIAIGKPPSKISADIRHVGRIFDQTMLNAYYAAADVMVIPSYADNYPNTVIESLVCGTPVFGYDEGGIPSQLNGSFGCVVPKGKWELIRSELYSYSLASGKNSDMANKLGIDAKNRWAVELVAKDYANLYQEVLSKSKVI